MSPEVLGVITAVVTGIVAALINLIIRHQQERSLTKARELGKVFVIPPFAAEASILTFLLVGIINVIMFLVLVTLGDISWQQIVWIDAILALPVAVMAYMLVINSGCIILTDHSVILNQMGRKLILRFDEIKDIKTRSRNPLFPHMVLIGKDSNLCINRRIENLTELYALIQKKINIRYESDLQSFPFNLRIRKAFVWSNAIGFFCIFTLLIVLAVVFAQQYPNPIKVGGILMAFSAVVLSAIVVIFLNQEGLLKQPLSYEFNDHAVCFKLLGTGPYSWAVNELTNIRICVEKSPIQASYQGSSVSEVKIQNHIVLVFEDKREILISERRCWQFGYSPESLLHILKNLYSYILIDGE